ncbi:hypothetical protein [Paenibacillus mucilaginosus]|uniref:Uncharacterized protein n=1 Tax=Paenibacillus mucilaginosus (strain KNP414) TaxID=1036673 RepID=F8FDQ9_PAEMK|nr:hypothetical protein [Paenibacillus mucilaginosus]AEI42624.1 hypothetical protein KNP414_04091 [Paenibacillus mucilaginosus KNP414]MCG7214014.1 hypothetical protein [Paenibacillus mucilaginosus]WDM26014.1 hypothetical protein KCX80_26750 [Paenibacillus mucilaginosus]
MPMTPVYALHMELPEDKRAGYYAQIVKGLAGRTRLLDREKETLIFASADDRDAAVPVMEQYKVPCEFENLLRLPSPLRLYPEFSDYGFLSRLEQAYLPAELAAVFRLAPEPGTGRPAEPRQAELQLREHLLADWPDEGEEKTYAVQAHQAELAEGIARAYGCRAVWLHRPEE